MQRAQTYDQILKGFSGRDTNFALGVSLNDISCVAALEEHVALATPRHLLTDLSRMVDTSMKLFAELSSRDFSPERKYAGPCAFVKARPEFFE